MPCLYLSCTLNSPCISWDAFKGGWQQNGLNGVCWRNTYQIWGHAIVGCGICKAYDFCWGCGSIMPCLLPSSPRYSDVEEKRRRRARGKRKELLITCFVWSESPCKYMNSKCRESNLVAHWYILLFAYLPAPVVSSCISGHGTSNTQRYAYIFFLFLFPLPPLSPSQSCPSFFPPVSSLFAFSPLTTPSTHPSLTHPFFPVCPSDIRVYFPPGRMHDRGAGGTESKWQISLSVLSWISLSLSLFHHLTYCPARGPPQPSFLPPSFHHLPILSDHIDIQICPGCIPPSLVVKVSSNRRGRKKSG